MGLAIAVTAGIAAPRVGPTLVTVTSTIAAAWPSRASAVAPETRAAPAAPSPVVERVDTSDTGDYAR